MKYLLFALTALLFTSCIPEEAHCPEDEAVAQGHALEGQQWEWVMSTNSDGTRNTPENGHTTLLEYSNGTYTRYVDGVVMEEMPYTTRPTNGDRVGNLMDMEHQASNTIYYEQGTVKQTYFIEETTLTLRDECDCREHTYRVY
ncbi:hypothetical protein KFE98_16510 [bacterium SCSIO 12741]|nr:hypothetical protein KFE98_16510 [bacterium SCSIO 12741]